ENTDYPRFPEPNQVKNILYFNSPIKYVNLLSGLFGSILIILRVICITKMTYLIKKKNNIF
ncbi:MAG: hypothetical protein ACI85O_003025, partial [Saprospiraceae bacterium]